MRGLLQVIEYGWAAVTSGPH
ncbi:rCG48341 [Rattus norvegicus]|uniref:RCG48341 n=1 Tax=Rattus norvegicus TaxID=10116 RepID=A6I0H9_RAT|nr:rCG48341 [Rattus norvegicus]